jgi:phosphoenolpyruvate synthase/pyruvate phosphate dikinase
MGQPGGSLAVADQIIDCAFDGQAPSDFPEVTRRLVEAGIDSISLNPDTVVRTIPIVFEAERLLADSLSQVAAR